jgi:hypothetical protein
MTTHTHTHHRPRRFSEGMEHLPRLAASARVGSFADGMAMAVVARAGSFADGLSLRPDAPPARRIGTFGDVGPVRPARSRRPLPRVARGGPHPHTA